MKRVLFLLSSGLLLAGSAQAQWGVRAGGSVAVFTRGDEAGNAETTTSLRPGYQVGLFYQMPLTKHLSLVPEVQFSREGFFVDKTFPVLSTLPNEPLLYDRSLHSRYHQSLSYLTIPVLLRVNLAEVYLEVGPQVSLLMGGYAEGNLERDFFGPGYTQVIPVVQAPIKVAATDSYHRFDAGPCVGMGVKLPAGLGLGLRAYWGLTKLTSAEDYSTSSNLYTGFQHRQTLQASLTYQLAAR